MKEALLFILKNWKIFLPVFLLIIGLCYFLKRKLEKQKSYKLETLIKNKLGNSHTVIKKDKVLYPNASSIDFNSKINLICELQKDPYIINCIGKNNSIIFERANFKKSKNIKDKYDLISKFNVDELAKQVEIITIKTNECFLTRDENTIGEIFVMNKSIKNKCDNTIHNIINEMKTNSKTVVSGTNLVIVMKHLERISEHCTNIAENVFFMINAKIIKHEKFDDKKSED